MVVHPRPAEYAQVCCVAALNKPPWKSVRVRSIIQRRRGLRRSARFGKSSGTLEVCSKSEDRIARDLFNKSDQQRFPALGYFTLFR